MRSSAAPLPVICLSVSILFGAPTARTVRPPLAFEPLPQAGTFLARAGGERLIVDSTGLVRSSTGPSLRLVNAAAPLHFAPLDRLPGSSSYFIGPPSDWRSGVPQFGRLSASGVYRSIDMVLYGWEGHLEYDFILAPGARPNELKLSFPEARSVRISTGGGLIVTTSSGEIHQCPPQVYQIVDGNRRSVAGRYRVARSGIVGFEVSSYDKKRTLVIDPVIDFSILVGGSGDDSATAIAVDAAGNVYLAGTTDSTDFATSGALHHAPTTSATDVFVTKLDPTNQTIIYTTVIGGSNADSASGIAVDSQGNAYVTGQTQSVDFPVTSGAYQTQSTAFNDNSFAFKLNPEGTSLVYSTYLSSQSSVSANAIAIDSAGNAYIAGSCDSPFGVTAGAAQATPPNPLLAPLLGFLAKLNATGSAFVYATYLTGSSGATATSVAVDAQGNAYVAGYTQSNDFPTTPGVVLAKSPLSTINNTISAGFAAKISPDGSAFVYSTYVGDASGSQAVSIAVDSTGAAYLTGSAGASFAATPGAASSSTGSTFVAKLNPSATAYDYVARLSTTMAQGNSFPAALQVDSQRDAFVLGENSGDLFTQPPVTESLEFGFTVSELDPTGANVIDSFFLPTPYTAALGMGPNSTIYVTGGEQTQNFITTDGRATTDGPSDAFLTAIDFSSKPAPQLQIDAGSLAFISVPTANGPSPLSPSSYSLSLTSSGGPLRFRIASEVMTTIGLTSIVENVAAPIAITPTEGVTPATVNISINGEEALGEAFFLDSFYLAIISPGSSNGVVLIPVAVEEPAVSLYAGAPSTYSNSSVVSFSFSDTTQPAQSQTIDISAFGILSPYRAPFSVSVPWQLAPSGGAPGWLGISSNSGVTPGSVTFTANPSDLKAGNGYSSLYSLRSPYDLGIAGANILVTATVGVITQLSLSPSSPSLILANSAASASQTVQLTSTGTPLAFTVGSGYASWLTVSPASGTTPAALTLTANGTGLAPSTGEYTTNLIITAGGLQYFYRVSLQVGTLLPQVNGIQSAAGSVQSIAPGGLVSIYGSNLATAATAASALPLPFSLGGVSATIHGKPMPLLYANPNQINAQLPFGLAPGTYDVVVTAPSGTAKTEATLVAAAPAIFIAGEGVYPQSYSQPIIINVADGSLNNPSHPAPPGGYLTVYLTGQGEVDQTLASGAAAPASPLVRPLLPVTATIGGLDAPVSFAGLAPGFVGLFQVNVQVPEIIASDNDLVITVGGSPSSLVPVAIAAH